MSQSPFVGIYTALITPFDSQGEIDWSSYEKLLDRQIEAKVGGVVPVGTTAESPTLSTKEKEDLIGRTIDQCKGTGLKVIAGTGSNQTANSISASRWASERGADGVLLVTPYYNKPSQEGLFQHFTAIADQIECEAVLYNVPGRSVVPIAADTVARLSGHSKINTIKEASGNPADTSRILNACRAAEQELTVLSGDDPTFLSFLSIGAMGAISVASNLVPKAMVKLCALALEGDFASARALHDQLFEPLRLSLSKPTPFRPRRRLRPSDSARPRFVLRWFRFQKAPQSSSGLASIA
jgi:4-hydroxy-tetrahydrodipicolinate synthase